MSHFFRFNHISEVQVNDASSKDSLSFTMPILHLALV